MKHKNLKIKELMLFFSALFFLFNSCNAQHTYNLSSESEKYLEEVVGLLQRNSVRKHQINWVEFKDEVFLFAKNSQTVKDTYPAVAYAIKRLEDNHSYFFPAITKESETQEEKPLPVLKDEFVPADIGYIRVSFCIGNETQRESYIQTIAHKIARQNNKNIKGWIVDLRDNFGGNMWPMMASIGSLLQTGTQGYFFDANDKLTEWNYSSGKAYLDATLVAENKNTTPIYGKNRIAVLINNRTASSGEAMAVLFKGYDNAKLFGIPTFGVSTGCEPFTLSDGSRINLATSVFADKNKTKYGSAIVPDVICTDVETLPSAIRWIDSQ